MRKGKNNHSNLTNHKNHSEDNVRRGRGAARSAAGDNLKKENKMKTILISIISIFFTCYCTVFTNNNFSIRFGVLYPSAGSFYITNDSLIISHYDYNIDSQRVELHYDFKKEFNDNERKTINKLFENIKIDKLEDEYINDNYYGHSSAEDLLNTDHVTMFLFEIRDENRIKKVYTAGCYLKIFSDIVDFIKEQMDNKHIIYYNTIMNREDVPCDCLDY